MSSNILTPSQTQDLLRKINHLPKKKLGQNFLIDSNIVRKSLDYAEVSENDTIIEIGPGLGTLTAGILKRGAKVFTVELDKKLAEHIRKTFGEKIDLKEGDATKFPIGNFDGNTNFKIVANLPYAISSIWIDKILEGKLPNKMVLMLQKEAADRFYAKPGTKAFGAISIFLQSAYGIANQHKVSSQCFHPVPKVDSCLIHLEKKKDPFIFNSETKKTIRHFFSQRRKQIGSLINQTKNPPFFDKWLEALSENGLDRTTRPEAIPLSLWLKCPNSGK